jgi:hypothetical protein
MTTQQMGAPAANSRSVCRAHSLACMRSSFAYVEESYDELRGAD